MNKEAIAKIKKFYEDALIDKMSELLGAAKDKVRANWNVDKTEVRVDMTTNDMVTNFTFTYKDENLTVEMESYKVLFNEVGTSRYINGVQAKSSTVDLQTMLVLQQNFKQILEQEYEDDEAQIAADHEDSAAEAVVDDEIVIDDKQS